MALLCGLAATSAARAQDAAEPAPDARPDAPSETETTSLDAADGETSSPDETAETDDRASTGDGADSDAPQAEADVDEVGEIGEAVTIEALEEHARADERHGPRIGGTRVLEVDPDAGDPLPYRARGPVTLTGEYRFRFHVGSDIPLQTQERTGLPEQLGQSVYATQWLRLTPRFERGNVEVVGQIDLFDGLAFGDVTRGVGAAERPRDERDAFRAGGVDPRWLYLSWRTNVGVVRAGLQPSHWGLGLLANDGNHAVPFGDYRYGNRNFRLLYATRPFGAHIPFNFIIAGDLVYADPIARLSNGQKALQAVFAMLYGDQDNGVGAYVVYRNQWRDAEGGGPIPAQIDDRLRVWILDVFARYEMDEPSGGRLFAAFEGIYFHGNANVARTVENPTQRVRQGLWAAQVGRESDLLDVVLEAGWTSGDSNPEDDVQRRATMHPDHRIGLILFPELFALSTARSATLARSPELVGRPLPGSEYLPTDGGVAGAAYLFQHVTIRPLEWLDVRLGWVWGRATADVVDPYRARAESRLVNYRGGDRRARDLGVEVDASVIGHIPLPRELDLEVGLEGGVAVPGRAFDDAEGRRMGALGLMRLRAGLVF
ncbi:MAG: hypothetical protein KF901_25670 [Myxococcales bacterium]|nr:hypothetical protein [Myxococcales bacterium]